MVRERDEPADKAKTQWADRRGSNGCEFCSGDAGAAARAGKGTLQKLIPLNVKVPKRQKLISPYKSSVGPRSQSPGNTVDGGSTSKTVSTVAQAGIGTLASQIPPHMLLAKQEAWPC